jgi:hypothetical protein
VWDYWSKGAQKEKKKITKWVKLKVLTSKAEPQMDGITEKFRRWLMK